MAFRFPRAAFSLLLCAACTQPSPPPPTSGAPVRTVDVTERGYEPARLEVEGGKPLTLRFMRKTTQTCGEAVLIDGDPVAHMLPVNRPVDVQVTAPRTGELAFVCGMHMMRGVLVAR
jgi:Cu+-exporting ATPase